MSISRLSRRRLAVVLCAAAVGTSLMACAPSDAADTLNVGFVVDPSWAQIPVAQAAGYFADEGVNVKVINFSTGVEALQALQGGQVDITTAADVPAAAALPKSPDLRVVADGSVWLGSKIVARKASGVSSGNDLGGKRIGTPIGTSAAYFAATMLDASGVTNAKLVQVAPSAMLTAMSQGDVDAVSIFQPYQEQVLDELADEVVALEAEGDVYRQHSLYLAQAESAEAKAAEFTKFFAALAKAGADLDQAEPAAIDAVVAATKLKPDLVGRVLEEFEFSLQLQPELASTLTDLAGWAREQGSLDDKVKPVDYARMLDDSALPTS